MPRRHFGILPIELHLRFKIISDEKHYGNPTKVFHRNETQISDTISYGIQRTYKRRKKSNRRQGN